MKDREEDDLTRGIKDLFENYEQDYVNGSWEDFATLNKGDKKRPVWIPLVKIAAVIALFMHFFPLPVNDIKQKKENGNQAEIKTTKTEQFTSKEKTELSQPAKSKVLVQAPSSSSVKGIADQFSPTASSSTLPLIAGKNIKQDAAPVNIGNEFINPVRPNSVQRNLQPNAVQPNLVQPNAAQTSGNVAIAQQDQPSKSEPLKENPVQEPEKSKIDRLFTLKENPVAKTEKKEPKWELGLEVASGVGSSKVNLSTGFNTQLNVTSKIAISSGINYVAMNGATKSNNNGGANNNTLAFQNSQLVATQATLQALDIPLNIVYKVNKHFYAAAGVSTVTVLQEKRSNDYLTKLPSQSAVVSSASPQLSDQANYNQVKTSQPTSDHAFKGNSYIGFANFSAGRTQQISGKQRIQIEPYLKLPLGKLSTGDLKLTTGGLRLIWGF